MEGSQNMFNKMEGPGSKQQEKHGDRYNWRIIGYTEESTLNSQKGQLMVFGEPQVWDIWIFQDLLDWSQQIQPPSVVCSANISKPPLPTLEKSKSMTWSCGKPNNQSSCSPTNYILKYNSCSQCHNSEKPTFISFRPYIQVSINLCTLSHNPF